MILFFSFNFLNWTQKYKNIPTIRTIILLFSVYLQYYMRAIQLRLFNGNSAQVASTKLL